MQPKQARAVSIRIFPPIDAPPGGHYASVVFQPLIPEGFLSTGTLSIPRISLQLLLLVKGDINEKMEISRVEIPKYHFGQSDLEGKIYVKNSGNSHSLPKVSVTIDKKEAIISDKKIVLPGTNRTF